MQFLNAINMLTNRVKVVVTAGASMQNYKNFVVYSIFKSIKDNFSNF